MPWDLNLCRSETTISIRCANRLGNLGEVMFGMFPPELGLPQPMVARFTENVGLLLAQIQANKGAQPLVYHYTTGSGLKGIAESKSIWATHIGFMNDTQEFREAVHHLSSLANQRLENQGLDDTLTPVVTMLAEATNSITADDIYPWFVTCFSENMDDLAQWRGYSGTESKFALGMELNHLAELTRRLSSREENGEKDRYLTYLIPVIYDVDQKTRLFNMILDFIIKQYPADEAEINPGDKAEFIRNWLRHYLSLASFIAPAVKNFAFAQEREWRLIVMPRNVQYVKFRNRGSLLTPYVEIELTPMTYNSGGKDWGHPVRECWVGPSPHNDSNRFSARNLLGQNGFGSVEMSLSTVPYRDL